MGSSGINAGAAAAAARASGDTARAEPTMHDSNKDSPVLDGSKDAPQGALGQTHQPMPMPMNQTSNAADTVPAVQMFDRETTTGKKEDAAAAASPSTMTPAAGGKAAGSTADSASQSSKENQAIVEVLLLSGSRTRFHFDLSTTISEVLARVYKEWPEAWEEARPV